LLSSQAGLHFLKGHGFSRATRDVDRHAFRRRRTAPAPKPSAPSELQLLGWGFSS